MSLNFRTVPSTMQYYQNNTLVGNWYEDRLAPPAQNDPKMLNTTERVFTRDFPAGVSDFTTTKQATDHSRMTSKPPQKVVKPSMYNGTNLVPRLETYGQPDATHYTVGRTLPPAADAPLPHDQERHLTTTNQVFYEQKPQTAKTLKPEYFTSTDRSHFLQGTMEKDFLDKARGEEAPSGKGARGEITRRPGESGNVYGVHVFVDEYAKWGTKLKDKMTLGETVSRMQTQYY